LSRGGDQVKPPDYPVAIINGLMIAMPTTFIMAYTSFELFEFSYGLVYDILLAASMFNCLRLIYKCASAEPGIVPAIPTPEISRKKTISKYPLMLSNLVPFLDIEYTPESFRPYRGDNAAHYYDQNRFRVTHMVDPSLDTYQLTYCTTCKILRPPRSFHCSTCGVCIENQDHHCPWMGTCIGKRNLSYFISFLFCTSLHAFIALGACSALFLKQGHSLSQGVMSEDLKVFSACNMAAMMYTAMIGATLFLFGLYTCCLAMDNITSNENLRTKWHAQHAKFEDRQRRMLSEKYESL
jgi:hypothetical protein